MRLTDLAITGILAVSSPSAQEIVYDELVEVSRIAKTCGEFDGETIDGLEYNVYYLTNGKISISYQDQGYNGHSDHHIGAGDDIWLRGPQGDINIILHEERFRIFFYEPERHFMSSKAPVKDLQRILDYTRSIRKTVPCASKTS